MKRYLMTMFVVAAMLGLAMPSPVMAEQPGFISAPGSTFNGGTINQGLTNNGGTAQVGSTVITAIGTPPAPAIVGGFTGGMTDYYWCVAQDKNAKETLVSLGTGTTGTTGTMSCGGQTGALTYALLRTASSGAPTGTGNFLVGLCMTSSGMACNVADAGNTLTTYTANSSDGTATLTFAALGSSIYEDNSGHLVIAGPTAGAYLSLPDAVIIGQSLSIVYHLVFTAAVGTDANSYELSQGTNTLLLNAPTGATVDQTVNNVIITVASATTFAANTPILFGTIYSAAGTAIPACATAYAHAAACVSDSTACTSLTTYASGGSTNCHVHCNGTNWLEDGFGC